MDKSIEDYLVPTDPPVPLPEIPTYEGENTLSCDSSLGDNNELTLNLDVATEVTNIEENVTTLKLLRTDKYMFENNVELVSSIYEITP